MNIKHLKCSKWVGVEDNLHLFYNTKEEGYCKGCPVCNNDKHLKDKQIMNNSTPIHEEIGILENVLDFKEDEIEELKAENKRLRSIIDNNPLISDIERELLSLLKEIIENETTNSHYTVAEIAQEILIQVKTL